MKKSKGLRKSKGMKKSKMTKKRGGFFGLFSTPTNPSPATPEKSNVTATPVTVPNPLPATPEKSNVTNPLPKVQGGGSRRKTKRRKAKK
jgi:hypothetical protein